VDRLQHYLDVAANAPPERDGRHFRAWQRVSVQAQREVRSLVAQSFFADEARVESNLDHAFSVAVYSACQPCYGRRPMEFTYDLGDLASITEALRLIGRGLQVRLTQISAGLDDPKLRRRLGPVWHLDILNVVKRKPRTLLEFLAREAMMVNALIELGTMRDKRTAKRFVKSTWAAARVLGVPSEALQDLVLRTGIENLVDGGVIKDSDMTSSGSPNGRIGGEEYSDHGRADGCGQMADPGVVPDVHASS
jgi:hypothetical protein